MYIQKFLSRFWEISIIILIFPIVLSADTEVSGYQSGTWTLANSPYIVTDNVNVPYDTTLTIEPGVEVKFDGGLKLTVEGTLIADGTEADNITFTSNSVSPEPGDWESIEFQGGSASILDHCVIAYGGYDWDQIGAVELVNASPIISNCDIINNSYGIVCYGTSNPPIHYNDICGNIEYGIYNADTVVTIDATSNWWGHDSGPCDTSSGPPDYNPDGSGDRVSDYIAYRPWLTGIEDALVVRTPKEFSLSQNFPNPMFKTTSINYAITKPVHVSIKIYDARGSLIKTLVNENKSPGYYSVQWGGKSNSEKKLSSGVYFYRLDVGEFKSTKKILLLK